MSLGKRTRPSNEGAKRNKTKKSEPTPTARPKTKPKTKEKGKMKAFIPIPGHSDDGQSEDEDEDMEDGDGDGDEDMLDEEVEMGDNAAAFLTGLDKKGITRSRKQQVVENRKARPKASAPSQFYRSLPKIGPTSNEALEDDKEDGEKIDDLDEDDFALLDSDDGDEDLDLLSDMPSSLSSTFSTGDDDFSDDDDISDDDDSDECLTDDSALEKAYYASKRSKLNGSDDEEANQPTESKLPVKLPDGTIQRFPNPNQTSGSRALKNTSSTAQLDSKPAQPQQKTAVGDSSHGARFGRLSLVDILTKRHGKKAAARTEIADLAREAISDPEMSLSLIKRLIALCLPTIKADTNLNGEIQIDPAIRFMALLSLLSVFLDIIPGYRIRALGDVEKQAAVSQMVARQREWEDGLVSSYKKFLEICENEVISAGVLGSVGLKCLCKLLSEKTHFNFSQNIMEVVVRKLGRKEWDEQSAECLDAIKAVFRKDLDGQDSLQLVRLIGRIIKARNYAVHPEVLACLLHLKLKDEISSGTRASTERIHKADGSRTGKLPWKERVKHKKDKTQPVILSKKAKKAIRDRRGIEKEIQEAEETVKVEEKERNQTETLKLIFALYFRILKLDHRSILFPTALEGLAKFAHLVNIDFFRDLMRVLRQHIDDQIFVSKSAGQEDEDQSTQIRRGREQLGDRLVCIRTAFELLSGQGEALNVDLTEFINDLYSILIPLGTQLTLEENQSTVMNQDDRSGLSNLDILFKALNLAFLTPRSTIPPLRAQAFTKRLLTITLSLASPISIIKILKFIIKLMHRQPVIKSILTLDDEESRRVGGIYRGELNDVGLSNADCAIGWEVLALERHWDERVQDAVKDLRAAVKDVSG
ncbi:CBF/Mak21 family-domain-containing protein [Melampsora americana]|nr:CBF/Mak21 family-domain-containing protein [Melampsora americana]